MSARRRTNESIPPFPQPAPHTQNQRQPPGYDNRFSFEEPGPFISETGFSPATNLGPYRNLSKPQINRPYGNLSKPQINRPYGNLFKPQINGPYGNLSKPQMYGFHQDLSNPQMTFSQMEFNPFTTHALRRGSEPVYPSTHNSHAASVPTGIDFATLSGMPPTYPSHQFQQLQTQPVQPVQPVQPKQQLELFDQFGRVQQVIPVEQIEQMGQIDQSEQTERMNQIQQLNINKLSESLQPEATSPQDRRDSLLFKPDVRSPKAKQPTGGGRRRRSEYAAPGSARAIYLEKNRKAASKCRNKQKHEQEQLVEKARETERTNRMLKDEVQVLQSELRAMKERLGKHVNCPDGRIAAYLQMEADRLASRHLHNPF